MALVETITSTFGETEIPTRTYRCEDCGERHESARDPERASCPECLSRDVVEVTD